MSFKYIFATIPYTMPLFEEALGEILMGHLIKCVQSGGLLLHHSSHYDFSEGSSSSRVVTTHYCVWLYFRTSQNHPRHLSLQEIVHEILKIDGFPVA